MLQKNIIPFLVFLLAASFAIHIRAEENKSDPFVSLLPQKGDKGLSGKKIVSPPPITIEGALWNTDTPQAIIDGDVYKVGDKLKGYDAKIYKIEGNVVSIFYEGRLFEMKVSRKKEAG